MWHARLKSQNRWRRSLENDAMHEVLGGLQCEGRHGELPRNNRFETDGADVRSPLIQRTETASQDRIEHEYRFAEREYFDVGKQECWKDGMLFAQSCVEFLRPLPPKLSPSGGGIFSCSVESSLGFFSS